MQLKYWLIPTPTITEYLTLGADPGLMFGGGGRQKSYFQADEKQKKMVLYFERRKEEMGNMEYLSLNLHQSDQKSIFKRQNSPENVILVENFLVK